MHCRLSCVLSLSLILSGYGAVFAANASTAANSTPPARPVLKKLEPKAAPTSTPQLPPPSPPPPPAEKPPVSNLPETYPVIAQLEQVTFGFTRPASAIADRLSQLENAVFHKTFTALSLQDRTQQLSDTLLGPPVNPDIAAPVIPPSDLSRGLQKPSNFEEDPRWNTPDFQKEISEEEAQKFSLQEINDERQLQGLPPLAWDATAGKVAKELVDDLTRRNVVSHSNPEGDNPDVRYTRAGGTDAVSESLVKLDGHGLKRTRASISQMIKMLNAHEDDREALLSPDASHFGFSVNSTVDKSRLIACAEVVTKHAIMHPIPDKVEVGEKIDVKGVILQPYKFQRVTIAWEGLNNGRTGLDEEEEALPYFPPLDYVAYGHKAEHGDHQKAAAVIRTGLMFAAIAGGLFMPPVALAAPLIAMSGGAPSEPHPVSEIPVHGGIKVDGSTFAGSVPISNCGKEGLYYVTVWATTGMDSKPIPISRRTVIATAMDKQTIKKHVSEEATGQVTSENTQQ